jgi:phytoene synthase
MVNKTIYSIFKRGSKTYFYSSIFFPREVKKDVFTLYGFVRMADNYVDSIPQDRDGFYAFWKHYREALSDKSTGNIVIDSFVDLKHKKGFPNQWVDSFLHSMEMDLSKRAYQTMDEVQKYMYGSAEVIGLFMAKIVGLCSGAFPYAKLLARSMQYINFIRDINEDIALKRTYVPKEILQSHDLEDLTWEHTSRHPEEYKGLIRDEIMRYYTWQKEAEKGYAFIPKWYLIPIKTAANMYKWTARQIYNDPFVVYQKKVKPPLYQILMSIMASSLGKIRGEPYKTPEDINL